jgi:hypothetical protein
MERRRPHDADDTGNPGRKTTLEYVRFLYIACGSVCELETQTMISGDLGYVGKERLQELREEIGDVERVLKAMIKSLENKHLNPWPRPINLTGLSINCQHCEAWPIA